MAGGCNVDRSAFSGACNSTARRRPLVQRVHLHQRVSESESPPSAARRAPPLFAKSLCSVVSRRDGMQYKRPRESGRDELLRRGPNSHRSPLASRRRADPLDARSTTRSLAARPRRPFPICAAHRSRRANRHQPVTLSGSLHRSRLKCGLCHLVFDTALVSPAVIRQLNVRRNVKSHCTALRRYLTRVL